MCNCAILDVTVKKILITAFLKKLPFLAKGLLQFDCLYVELAISSLLVLSIIEQFVKVDALILEGHYKSEQ